MLQRLVDSIQRRMDSLRVDQAVELPTIVPVIRLPIVLHAIVAGFSRALQTVSPTCYAPSTQGSPL